MFNQMVTICYRMFNIEPSSEPILLAQLHSYNSVQHILFSLKRKDTFNFRSKVGKLSRYMYKNREKWREKAISILCRMSLGCLTKGGVS